MFNFSPVNTCWTLPAGTSEKKSNYSKKSGPFWSYFLLSWPIWKMCFKQFLCSILVEGGLSVWCVHPWKSFVWCSGRKDYLTVTFAVAASCLRSLARLFWLAQWPAAGLLAGFPSERIGGPLSFKNELLGINSLTGVYWRQKMIKYLRSPVDVYLNSKIQGDGLDFSQGFQEVWRSIRIHI